MKFDKSKLISIGSFAVGCIGLLLSSMQSKNDKNELKEEIKKDILLEMNKGSE